MKIKTIVVDLDRTLLHTDKTLSPYTVKVLKECQKKSIKVMVATARPLRTTIPYHELVGFDAMVVSNGARILYDNQRMEYGIHPEIAAGLLNALESHPSLRITVETGDCAYSNKEIGDYETIITDDLTGVIKTEGVLKILVHLDQEETLEIVKRELTEDLYFTVANGYLMQIMHRSATKWNGIQTMLKLTGGSREETIYFGDDHDDIEPIQRCGLGIAVSNGIEEVKEAADRIAGSNDEDGVARFIEQML